MFCLRVMVAVIILYDHVHPIGAFAKTSPIDVSSLHCFDFDFNSVCFLPVVFFHRCWSTCKLSIVPCFNATPVLVCFKNK